MSRQNREKTDVRADVENRCGLRRQTIKQARSFGLVAAPTAPENLIGDPVVAARPQAKNPSVGQTFLRDASARQMRNQPFRLATAALQQLARTRRGRVVQRWPDAQSFGSAFQWFGHFAHSRASITIGRPEMESLI